MTVITFPETQQRDLADSRERAQALDITSSWIVEAPAGSGKTGLLIQRFLKLLPTVRVPGEVLALTFTQKATAEMRDRIVTALRSVQDGSFNIRSDFDRLTYRLVQAVLEHDREQNWRLLERPYQLNIRTIDSLCGEIAQLVPLVAGGAGYSRPVRDAGPLYRRAAHAVMMRFGGGDGALNAAVHAVLLHRDGNLSNVESILATMLGTREQWIRLVPLDGETLTDEALDRDVLPRLNGALERTVCAALTHLHQCFPEEHLVHVADIARQLAGVAGYNGDPNPFTPCVAFADVPEGDAKHHNHWLILAGLLLTKDGKWRAGFGKNHIGAEAPKGTKETLTQLIRELQDSDADIGAVLHAVRDLPPFPYPPEQWSVAKALFRLLRYALDELQTLFAVEDVCDFPAVSLIARSVLKQHSNGSDGLAMQLRHLLVDEMQDTSSAQYELLEDLTAQWDGRSRTVFLVGDPKQSIYLFRQARVELFQQAMEKARMGSVPLGPLRLRANFRSGSHLVSQFNTVFGTIFPRESAGDGEVTYTPVSAVMGEASGETFEWVLRSLPYVDNDTTARRQQRSRALQHEARSIAKRIKEYRRERGGACTIAVLTRSRNHVTEVTKELASEGIPFRAVEMEVLGERQEVLDVLAVTRALLHQADRIAWLAVLRAPWCGAGVADLFTLAGGDVHAERKQALRQRFRTRATLLDEPVRGRMLRTLDVMDSALSHTGTEPLGTRVERTWRSLGGDVCTDAQGRENVRLFLRVVDTMESEGEPISSYALDIRLKTLFAEPTQAEHAVDVMTIHRAKGLEWDIVLIPGTHRLTGRSATVLLDWLELPTQAPDGRRDILLAPFASSAGEKCSLNDFIRSTRKRRAGAEVKRLLYVAATRARTALHLFAWPDKTKDGDEARINDTLYGVARPSIPLLTPHTATLELEESEPLALAASAATEAALHSRKPMPIKRLIAHYDPLERLHRAALPGTIAASPRVQRFTRPEGSFGARAVGTVIHGFVERLHHEFALRLPGSNADAAARQLQQELPSWQSAVHTTLRAGGLSPAEAERAGRTVLRALQTFLESREGRWLLLPHPGAAIEASWRSPGATGQIRVDRSFFAGTTPHAAGGDVLWIVDFKTGDHDRDIEAFLQGERLRYEPQLRTYAEVLRRSHPPETPVMLALFYPLLGRLEYWPYENKHIEQPKEPEAKVTPMEKFELQLSLF